MCDFYCPSATVEMQLQPSAEDPIPDMDDLLDQLEHESKDVVCRPTQQLAINIKTVSVLSATKEPDLVEELLIDEACASEIAEVGKLEGLLLSQDDEATAVATEECSILIDLENANVELMPEIEESNKNQTTECENMNEMVLFDEIDRMDAIIRAEEEQSLLLNSNKDSIPIPCTASFAATINSDDNQHCELEQFVDAILDNIFDQVFSVSSEGEHFDEALKTIECVGQNEEMKVEAEDDRIENETIDDDGDLDFNNGESVPSSSIIQNQRDNNDSGRFALTTVHDLSANLDEFKLTESELMLGKQKPYWIPDEDCPTCMLCSLRFSLVNRRHHCRACGRVLCRSCCAQRRALAYMDDREGKQRVCSPCNRTLDRIEQYEKRMAETENDEMTNGLSVKWNPRNELDFRNGSNSDEYQLGLQSAPEDLTSNNVMVSSNNAFSAATRPPKKSLLKPPGGRHLSVDGDADVEPFTSDVDTTERRPSVLGDVAENSNQEMAQQTIMATTSKRSVTFRDGVNPGDDSRPTSSTTLPGVGAATKTSAQPPYQWQARAGVSETVPPPSSSADLQNENGNGKKLPRKISRRSRERRIEEESQSLLQSERICLVEPAALHRTGDELVPSQLDEIAAELLSSQEVLRLRRIAIRRNFHLQAEKRRVLVGEREQEVLCFCTNGLAAIGTDELFLAMEFESTKFEESELKSEFLAILEQFDYIFQQCLAPQEESSLDHRMGIRKLCSSRMNRLYPLYKKRTSLFGHQAASILFHRPLGQTALDKFSTPTGPFLIGTFVRTEELPWAMCVPTRVLLRLGLLHGEYPTPVVNVNRVQHVFTGAAVQSSVLKVLNDFRQWNYRMVRLPGTVVATREDSTDIILPHWALDEVRMLVETNRNMVGWAIAELATTELQVGVDSHLVCIQEGDSPICFKTRIFARDQSNPAQRKTTGASFVIFDGALKSGEQFTVSVVEDGLVIRLHADLMEELVKSLLAGEHFFAINDREHRLDVHFLSNTPRPGCSESVSVGHGSLSSPIDGRPLDGQFQYGLILARQLRSLNFFPYTSEWALRLSTVINLLPGKFPSALQPRFFDVCEQLAAHVVPTLEPFLQDLTSADQRSISLRIHIDDESISYETERWPSLPDQHFVWCLTMDEQIIPFLYAQCAWIPSGFHVELHMTIVSTRPVPVLTVPADV